MSQIVEFLQAVFAASVARLIKRVISTLKKGKWGHVIEFQMTAAAQALRSASMTEELRWFGLTCLTLLAEMGKTLPEKVREILESLDILEEQAKTTAPATPAKPTNVPQPAAAVPATPAPKPVLSATGPARTVEATPVSPENRRDKWVKILSSFVAGSAHIDWGKTSQFTTSIFQSNVSILPEHWQVFFDAMRKAASLGKFILHKDADPLKVFKQAPLNLLDDFVFGQDGAIVSCLSSFSEVAGTMPSWLIGKTSVCLDAIEALSEGRKFGPQEVRQIKKLADEIEAHNGPDWMLKIADSVIAKFTVCKKTKGNGTMAAGLKAAVKALQERPATPEEHAAAQSSEELAKAASDAAGRIAAAQEAPASSTVN